MAGINSDEVITRELEASRASRAHSFRVARLFGIFLLACCLALGVWLALDLTDSLTSKGRLVFALFLGAGATVFGVADRYFYERRWLRLVVAALGVWFIGTGLYLIVGTFGA